jgi:tRNA pseudouridine55 synthase
MSSNLAMMVVRRILAENTGYIGTLDPFATGVLPIAVGKARRFIRFIEKSTKEYVFTMVFGKSTNTIDKSGKIIGETANIPTKMTILEVMKSFIGTIEQLPPSFSAIKIGGIRACDRVRRGEDVKLPIRNVCIHSLEVLGNNLEERHAITMKVTCSAGTYVRSIARDIAEKSGSMAYVESLCRLKSGFFSFNNAISMEKLLKIRDTGKLVDVLIPMESPLDDIPALYIRGDDITKLQNGVQVPAERSELALSNVRIMDDSVGKFHGIGLISNDGFVKPVSMLVDN